MELSAACVGERDFTVSIRTNLITDKRQLLIYLGTDIFAAVNGILTAFVKQSYETGHLGFACIVGTSSQTFEERMSCAAATNDEKIVFVLNGWTSATGEIYDGWRAAARIDGMISSVETNSSLTNNVISGALNLTEPLTNSEIIRAEQKGCLVLALNYNDQIKIDNAITTLATPDSSMDDGWKKIRHTKTRFEVIDRINASCEPLIGDVNNDDRDCGTVVGIMQRVPNEMIAEGKMFDGSFA